MSTGVPKKGGQKGSTVKDPDRTSLPPKLPKTISVSSTKSSLYFTNIINRVNQSPTQTKPFNTHTPTTFRQVCESEYLPPYRRFSSQTPQY